jgi:hypothetical protein
LAKGALDARDDAKVRGALSDLQMKLFDAMSAALAIAEKATSLQSALSKVEAEKADLEAKLKDRASYELCEITPGAFAYAPKPAADAGGVPRHYLCQACHDKGVTAMLRHTPPSVGMDARWVCPEEPGHGIIANGTALPVQVLSAKPRGRI